MPTRRIVRLTSEMDLTALQADLLNRIRAAVEGLPIRQVVYCTEWLGYLPFGLYHWIECAGQDISRSFPPAWRLEWSRADLEALAEAGLLRAVGHQQNPVDAFDTKFTYEVPLA